MSKKLHDLLSSHGIRIFAMRLAPSREYKFWVHDNKTSAEFREDVKQFRDKPTIDKNGYANDVIDNELYKHLWKLGYAEVEDVVSDVFEGRITNETARIIDDPDHSEEQEDGFGHFGWDSK